MRGTAHSMAVSSKLSFENDKDDNRFSIDIGSSFKMHGEWLEFACI